MLCYNLYIESITGFLMKGYTMEKCISGNSKTLKSCDFSTNCPKRRDGKECDYCYARTARDHNFNAKKIYDAKYTGEVMRMKKSTIKRLNKGGGLRMFSFGDYMPFMNADIKAMLDDCLNVGLGVKVITKQTSFVKKFHDHKAINVIHLSVDTIGCGILLSTASNMKNRYKKVAIRCVCLTMNDVEFYGKNKNIDIMTLNHGANGFEQFRGAKKMAIEKKYKGRVCCNTGKCETCKIKCRRAKV